MLRRPFFKIFQHVWKIHVVRVNVKKSWWFFSQWKVEVPFPLGIIPFPSLSMTEQVPRLETIMCDKTPIGRNWLDLPCLNDIEVL